MRADGMRFRGMAPPCSLSFIWSGNGMHHPLALYQGSAYITANPLEVLEIVAQFA
jgi:hypothetical protein